MGKTTGFLDYSRRTSQEREPLDRIRDFEPFHAAMPLSLLKEQSARCMNCGTPFCHSGVNWQGVVSGCPLGNLIPEWNDLVYRGLYHEAWLRLKLTTPFPEFTSRVCPALCEGACACGGQGEAVTVREIERFLSDTAFEQGWEQPRQPRSHGRAAPEGCDQPRSHGRAAPEGCDQPKARTGKRVSVIGAGPAGLACAWKLNRMGHDVTVYEKNELPGGLLMFGIPNMKLPKSVVQRRVALMEQEGVKFVCNAPVGEAAIKGLEETAVALCCGAEIPRDLKVPGRDLKGIEFAVPYLAQATRNMLAGRAGERPLFGKSVVVIGGGDTGNDCAGTAIRQGATKLAELEIMPPLPSCRADSNPWPRWPFVFKTDYGQEEACAVWGSDPREFCTTATEFLGENGHVKAVNTVSVEWVNQDGRRVPAPIPGTEKTHPADLVLIAMGFTGADQSVYNALGGRKGEEEGVFVCGDMRTGQSLVVKAMADGLATAQKIDGYLSQS